MAQNMYRVGDYVYFEVSSSAPYQIRKIEELNKTASGHVEARVICFYRRRDISPALLKIADQAERKFDYFETDEPAASGSEKGQNGKAEEEEGEEKEDGAAVQNGVVKEEKKEKEEEQPGRREWGLAGLPTGTDSLDDTRRHLLRQRELYVSRHVETLPATHIRGKCMVTLLSEVEMPQSYEREDAFFYSLMYDPSQMTLLADKGAIRVGEKYQAVVPDSVEGEEAPKGEPLDENKENGELMIAEEEETAEGGSSSKSEGEKEREVTVYHPHHSLTDRDIDQFLIIARAVGTFSRALDTSSSTKLPSLHMTAAAASRDVTLLHAMALLHLANYDIGQATKFLVPPPSKQHYPLEADKTTSHKTVSLGGPILCRDQMEEWSAAEANLFEEAVEKYGKDFNDVRGDFLPWKSIRDIVEYYYMWKTTNRYVEIKKNKAHDSDSKLKQVYIPSYNKMNPNQIVTPNATAGQPIRGTVPCESCKVEESLAWFGWGPASACLRLCQECWIHWKKMGGLKTRNEFELYDVDGGVAVTSDMLSNQQLAALKAGAATINSFSINKNAPPRAGGQLPRAASQIVARLPAGHIQSSSAHAAAATAKQSRVAFFQRTDPKTRIERRLSSRSGGALNMRKAARTPFRAIDSAAIKAYCQRVPPNDILKCAMSVLKHPQGVSLPTSLVQLLTSGAFFAPTTKRPLSNGAEGGPPPKKPATLRTPLPDPPMRCGSGSLWLEGRQRLVFLAGSSLKVWRKALNRVACRSMRRVRLSPNQPAPDSLLQLLCAADIYVTKR